MKKYVVEIVAKIAYKVEVEAESTSEAENLASHQYDTGQLEGKGKLFSVSFETEEKEDE